MGARALTVVVMAGAMAVWAAPAVAQDNGYAGAESCRSCHEKIYDAWSATKHAGTIRRLSGDEKASGKCSRCHTTGTIESIAAEGAKPALPGVQCEMCHGMGKLHAQRAATNPPALVAIARKPAEGTCLQCHNSESPHYRGFFYEGMKTFVHKVK